MKKVLCMVLTLACAVSLVACGGSKDSDGKSNEKVTAKVIEQNLTDEEYAFGVDKTQPELLTQVNDFIAQIKKDGTLEEICDRYFGDGEPVAVTSAEPVTTELSVSNGCWFMA